MDLNVSICDGKFRVKVYDKRDDFPFQIVQFSKKNCNLSRKSVLGVFQSQIVRYFRICSDLDGFTERLTNIVDTFVTLGFDSKLLKSRFGTLAIKHDFR